MMLMPPTRQGPDRDSVGAFRTRDHGQPYCAFILRPAGRPKAVVLGRKDHTMVGDWQSPNPRLGGWSEVAAPVPAPRRLIA